MSTIPPVIVMFQRNSLPGNAANGFTTAANAVATDQSGVIWKETAVGVAQTGTSIAAIVAPAARSVPLVGIPLSGAAGFFSYQKIQSNINDNKPISVSDAAALAGSGLALVGAAAGFVILAVPATAIGAVATVILVPVTLLAAAAGGIQFATQGWEYDTNTQKFVSTNLNANQRSQLSGIASTTKFAPDGVTPLGVTFSASTPEVRSDIVWSRDPVTGNYFKAEKITVFNEAGNPSEITQTQSKYIVDNLTKEVRLTEKVVTLYDANGLPIGGSNFVGGSDGKTLVRSPALQVVNNPPRPPVTVDPLNIQTDPIPNTDSYTLTSTQNTRTGSITFTIRDSTGVPVMTTAPGQVLVRDSQSGVYTITSPSSAAYEIYDPLSGRRILVDAAGAGRVLGQGIDAGGYPNPDIEFAAGGLNRNSDGSLSVTPLNTPGEPIVTVDLFRPSEIYNLRTTVLGNTISGQTIQRDGSVLGRGTYQTDDEGNVLQVITNADGSGVVRAVAPDGTVISQYDLQRSDSTGQGSVDGANGTLSGQVNGQAVVFAADFGYEEEAGTTVNITGITSINGQPVNAVSHGIDASDLQAYGYIWQNLVTDGLSDSAAALIDGLDPASIAAAGQPTPQVVQTTQPNGTIERSIELPNGVTLTTISNAAGTPLRLEETRTSGNQVTTTNYTVNADGSRTGTSIVSGVYSSSGAFVGQETDLATRAVVKITRESDGTETRTPNPEATTTLLNQQATSVLNDVSGLISAIQGGRPLPILNSGLRLVNNLANPSVGGTAVINYPGLNLGTGIVSGLASLYNLSNALQNGDDLTKLSATLNTLNYFNSTLPTLLSGAGAAPLSAGLNGFLNGTGGGLINGGAPGAIPVIGLIISIKNGDPFGTISGIIGIVNPALLTTPVGWILAIASIVYSLTKETPESWGTARIIFDANGQIGIDTVGEGSGPQRVRQQLENTLAALNEQIADVRLSNPSALIGIVPQRTPSITWREQRQDDQGYAIVDIDPVTGQQRYPYLRFDDNGVPFSSQPQLWQPDPLDPGIRVAFNQQLTYSALRREAIAPQWVVDTARIQQDVGDPNAGLVEQERAAKLGLGATYDSVTKLPIGQFRPITLDLDGNGTITTVAKDAASNTVAFDWDDSGSRSDTGQGFLKQVAWVQPNDGFLFVDRNLNGGATVAGQALKATENTTYLIAAPAIFYWARGLKGSEKRAQNDEFWRAVA